MRTIGTLTAVTLLFCCLCASAQEPRPAPATPGPEAIHYGWADVLRVDPIYDEAAPAPASAPHEECYEEQTLQPAEPDDRAGNTVLGAIVGGVIGHSFGKGSGRVATTVAGATAGAAIGNSAGHGGESGYAATERHCRMVDTANGAHHVVGYDVEYRYRGERYTSRMNYDPGERIRVRISVTPAE
jgi:uncharacterized protein YcfJ